MFDCKIYSDNFEYHTPVYILSCPDADLVHIYFTIANIFIRGIRFTGVKSYDLYSKVRYGEQSVPLTVVELNFYGLIIKGFITLSRIEPIFNFADNLHVL